MLALARLWTWIGHLFVPLAIGWAYFVSGGEEGIAISRGYWGLLLSLLVSAALISVLASYIWAARVARASIVVPPNMTFEDDENRNTMISWGTVVVFLLIATAAIISFGNRYSSSHIHLWNKTEPLDNSFWGSRAKARAMACADKSCFSMGRRVDGSGKSIEHVDQYFPYLTDGTVAALAILLLASIGFLILAIFKPVPPGPPIEP